MNSDETAGGGGQRGVGGHGSAGGPGDRLGQQEGGVYGQGDREGEQADGDGHGGVGGQSGGGIAAQNDTAWDNTLR